MRWNDSSLLAKLPPLTQLATCAPPLGRPLQARSSTPSSQYVSLVSKRGTPFFGPRRSSTDQPLRLPPNPTSPLVPIELTVTASFGSIPWYPGAAIGTLCTDRPK